METAKFLGYYDTENLIGVYIGKQARQGSSLGSALLKFTQGKKHNTYLSHDMRFPTMWYVQPAKPQISLRIHAV